jgi:MoaA/NifB/PqqE/SkfB family radical SAM enzyme
MNFYEIKKIIKEFAKINDKQGTLNMFGGEIFLRKDIFNIIDYAISLGVNIGITTNANLSRETLKKIIKREIGRISIDINGANSHTHDWLRNKKGHFRQSLQVIKTFVKSGKFTASNIILHRNNVLEIEKILALCQQIGINSISCYLFTPLGRGKDIKDLILDPTEWKKARKKVKKWISNHSPNFGIIWERAYEYLDKIDNLPLSPCRGRSSNAIDIRCDGNVYYCGLLSAVDFGCLGDAKKETLMAILNKRKKYAIKVKSGCAALAYDYSPERLIDPRSSINEIIPVCPYDWELLCGSSDLKRKFTYINPL